MTLLPPAVSTVYDTTGWSCINRHMDGDRFVMLRPPPPIRVRGDGAQPRRT